MRLACALVLLCGCSDTLHVPEEVRPTRCAPSERMGRTTCVPAAFDQAILPSSPPSEIETAADGNHYIKGTLLIGLNDPTADGMAVISRYGGQLVGALPFAGLYHASFSGSADSAATLLAADSAVAFAERDQVLDQPILDRPPNDFDRLTPMSPVSDYYFDYLPAGQLGNVPGGEGRWAWYSADVPNAWQTLYSANPITFPVVVGLLDSVVEKNPIFTRVDFVGGHDYRIHNDRFSLEDKKHATAVASIIGAPVNLLGGVNGILGGIKCIDYQLTSTTVVDEQPFDLAGVDTAGVKALAQLQTSAVFYGVVAAVQAEARAVNLSLGSSCQSISRRTNLARNLRTVMAAAPRVLFVVAAGNDDVDAANSWPVSAARIDEQGYAGNVLAVSGYGHNYGKAQFTLTPFCNSDHSCWVPTPPQLCASPASYAPSSASCATNADCAGVAVINGGSNYFSTENYGQNVISAPAVDELSMLPDGRLTMFGGTSGAAPMVTGAAGLLFAILPALSGEQAKQLLVQAAQSMSNEVKLTDTTLGPPLDVALAVGSAEYLQSQLAPDLAGQGKCGPINPPPTPPPLLHTHTPTGFWLSTNAVCQLALDNQGYCNSDSYVEMTANWEGHGVTLETAGVNALYNDIVVGDAKLHPVPGAASTFLHWEGACAGPWATHTGSDVNLHLEVDSACVAVFDK